MIAPREDSKRWLKVIGANLKAIRTSRNELIRDVSKKVNISESLLKMIEEGGYDMYLDLFADLCHHYKVQMADVVSENFKYSDK